MKFIDFRSSIENNLQDIMHEKNLIKAGQLEVAQMIGALKKKLDNGLLTLDSQSSQSRANHADLLSDLSMLHDNAVRVSQKLEEAMEYILTQSAVASVQFEATVEQLNDINKTVFDVADLIKQLRNDLEEQLQWISSKVGGTEVFVVKLQVTAQYLGFLLLGMLMLVFVNAASFYRMVFLAGVVLTYGLIITDVYPIRMMHMHAALATIFFGSLFKFMFLSQILMTTISSISGHFIYQHLSWLTCGSLLLTKKQNKNESDCDEPDTTIKGPRDKMSEYSFQGKDFHARIKTPLMDRFLEDNNNHSRR